MQPALSVVPSVPNLQDLLSAHPKNGSNIKLTRIYWGKLTAEQKLKAVQEHPKHVAYWQATGKDLEFIPKLNNWLKNECFEDELPEIGVKKSEPWWRSNAGIEAEFKRRGKEIPPGKSWDECRQILMEAR